MRPSFITEKEGHNGPQFLPTIYPNTTKKAPNSIVQNVDGRSKEINTPTPAAINAMPSG